MNPICNFCKHQEQDYKGGVRCGKATYKFNDVYGAAVSVGAVCIYDEDLKNLFSPGENKKAIEVMSNTLEMNRKDLSKMRDQVRNLQQKLITLGMEDD